MLTWKDKGLWDSMLSVAVYDKDTLSDDLMGDHQINLNQLKLEEEAESGAEAYEMTTKNGKAAGKVVQSLHASGGAGG